MSSSFRENIISYLGDIPFKEQQRLFCFRWVNVTVNSVRLFKRFSAMIIEMFLFKLWSFQRASEWSVLNIAINRLCCEIRRRLRPLCSVLTHTVHIEWVSGLSLGPLSGCGRRIRPSKAPPLQTAAINREQRKPLPFNNTEIIGLILENDNCRSEEKSYANQTMNFCLKKSRQTLEKLKTFSKYSQQMKLWIKNTFQWEERSEIYFSRENQIWNYLLRYQCQVLCIKLEKIQNKNESAFEIWIF